MLGIFKSRSSGKESPPWAKPFTHFSVIDPGGTTLRVLTVEVASGQSTVWGWAEKTDWSGPDFDLQDLFGICEDLRAQAEEMARDRAERWFLPDQVMIGLPASQLVGRAWPMTLQRPKPEQPIDERELEALLARALRLAVNRLLSIIQPHTGLKDPDWVLVDAVPASTQVDGRGVTDPVGFRGQEITATVFAALGRLNVLNTWRRIAERLEFTSMTLAAAPLALAASQSESQGILVDVGGAATDLTWWRNGRPLAMDTLPLAGKAVNDALVRRWRLSNAKAERLKRAYTGGRLQEGANAEVLGVIAPTLRTWVEGTEVALDRLNEDGDETLPQHLALLGGGGALSEMEDALGTLAWSECLDFERYPQVTRLRPTDVPGVVNRTDRGREPGDVAVLALAAWAAEQTLPQDRPARLLSQICQE